MMSAHRLYLFKFVVQFFKFTFYFFLFLKIFPDNASPVRKEGVVHGL